MLRTITSALLAGLVLAVVGCGSGKGTVSSGSKLGQAIPADMAATTAKQLTDSAAAYEGKDVLVTGTITSECPSGCWIFVQDKTGEIYVSTSTTGIVIPQRVHRSVRVMGKVVLEQGRPQIAGTGVELL